MRLRVRRLSGGAGAEIVGIGLPVAFPAEGADGRCRRDAVMRRRGDCYRAVAREQCRSLVASKVGSRAIGAPFSRSASCNSWSFRRLSRNSPEVPKRPRRGAVSPVTPRRPLRIWVRKTSRARWGRSFGPWSRRRRLDGLRRWGYVGGSGGGCRDSRQGERGNAHGIHRGRESIAANDGSAGLSEHRVG